MSTYLYDNAQHGFDEDGLLPMMSLREVVMFPRSIVPLFVGREACIKAIENAVAAHDKKIFWWPSAPRKPSVRCPTISSTSAR
jgi:ATP-dependent Lon protease